MRGFLVDLWPAVAPKNGPSARRIGSAAVRRATTVAEAHLPEPFV
jgi:hypothetical protein